MDVYFSDADVIRLVVENLNIHNLAGLYEVCEPQEARWFVQKIELHYTPLKLKNKGNAVMASSMWNR